MLQSHLMAGHVRSNDLACCLCEVKSEDKEVPEAVLDTFTTYKFCNWPTG